MFDNMIDIHSHSLWGLDDGSRSFDETLDMCFCAEDNGTGILFVTPHLMYWDTAESLYDKREEKVHILEDNLDEQGSSLIIKKGFEILCDDDIFAIKHFKPYTLNGSRYVLIEFDFLKTSEEDVASWCNYLKSFGLVPVIAHPERYGFVLDDITCINRLSDNGVLFQINAGSPAGAFGEGEMRVSCNMINCGFVDFIGSDAHRINMRNTNMAFSIEGYPESVDMDVIRKAALVNPKVILNDSEYIPERKKYITKL